MPDVLAVRVSLDQLGAKCGDFKPRSRLIRILSVRLDKVLRTKFGQNAAHNWLDAIVVTSSAERLDQVVLMDAVAPPRALAPAQDICVFPCLSTLIVVCPVQVPVFQDRSERVAVKRDRHVPVPWQILPILKSIYRVNPTSSKMEPLRPGRISSGDQPGVPMEQLYPAVITCCATRGAQSRFQGVGYQRLVAAHRRTVGPALAS
jgi:hypothetical protein